MPLLPNYQLYLSPSTSSTSASGGAPPPFYLFSISPPTNSHKSTLHHPTPQTKSTSTLPPSPFSRSPTKRNRNRPHRFRVLPPPPHRRSPPTIPVFFQSLREAAASIIQSHFRVFLARRSRTLRQLKDLASIKSTLSILKSSVSKNIHFDYEALSHKSMALLLKLDSIKSADPMIRDGKRSVSRELINFLEFIDGSKRRGLSSRLVKNVRNGENNVKSRVLQGKVIIGNVNVEKLKGLVERLSDSDEGVELIEHSGGSDTSTIRNQDVFQNRDGGLMKRDGGVLSKARKSVSFAENRNVHRVYRSNGKPFSNEDCNNSIDGDDSINSERELVDNLCQEVEDIGVSSKDQSENGASRGSDN